MATPAHEDHGARRDGRALGRKNYRWIDTGIGRGDQGNGASVGGQGKGEGTGRTGSVAGQDGTAGGGEERAGVVEASIHQGVRDANLGPSGSSDRGAVPDPER